MVQLSPFCTRGVLYHECCLALTSAGTVLRRVICTSAGLALLFSRWLWSIGLMSNVSVVVVIIWVSYVFTAVLVKSSSAGLGPD